MNEYDHKYTKEQIRTVKFLAGVFGVKDPFQKDVGLAFSAPLPLGVNQPEFWADAPWRIEPDQDDLNVLFLIREANIQSPAKGPWRLDLLKIDQALTDGTWDSLRSFTPANLVHVDSKGSSLRRTWTHSSKISLTELQEKKRGDTIHLRAVFMGSFHPHEKPDRTEVHLKTYLAKDPLPLGRAAEKDKPRKWFYGDTHYHSIYTNDIKEIGNPVLESCQAASEIGLDWLVITDHSCDLDDKDTDVSQSIRWDRLKEDISNLPTPRDEFLCILGEEITLVGKDENYVHMLAFGSMDKMVKGAFLPYKGGFLTEWVQEKIDKLLKKSIKKNGYPSDSATRLFGKVHSFEKVLNLLPDDTLTFAAHPYQFAQPPPPGRWVTEDLYHQRLTGYEFWNGRSRCSMYMTLNPFAKNKWEDPVRLAKKDQDRIKKLRKRVEGEWDLALRRGLKEWDVAGEPPQQRPVFIAGSDAHGSFNYSIGLSWDYQRRLVVDDNALGRVRTVVYLPDNQTNVVPPEDALLEAIKKGSCVVTDGPVIAFSLKFNGKTANMGDVLLVTGGGDVILEIAAHTSPEFGPAHEVELFTCFKPHRKTNKTSIQIGETRTIDLDGVQGFCRVFVQTIGPEGEQFCCFTNPIWIQAQDSEEYKIRAAFK